MTAHETVTYQRTGENRYRWTCACGTHGEADGYTARTQYLLHTETFIDAMTYTQASTEASHTADLAVHAARQDGTTDRNTLADIWATVRKRELAVRGY